MICLILYIDNPYFEQMVSQVYSIELQLNNANYVDTELAYLTCPYQIAQFHIKCTIFYTHHILIER